MAMCKTHPDLFDISMAPSSLSAQEHIDSLERELFTLQQQTGPASHTRAQKGKDVVVPKTNKDNKQAESEHSNHHAQPRQYYAQKSSLLMQHHHLHQCHSKWRSHKQLFPPPIAKSQNTHSPMHVTPAMWYCRITTMQEYSSHQLARIQSQPIALSLQYIMTRL